MYDLWCMSKSASGRKSRQFPPAGQILTKRQPLKSNREKERETLRAVGSYQQLTLHHFLSFLYSHYPTSSHHQMTPSQLEMYVRICVERIFFSFFSPTYCYDSIHPLEQGWEEKSVGLPCFSLNFSLYLTTCFPSAQSCKATLFLLKLNPGLVPAYETYNRQTERNSSAVGCVKEVGTETTSWL